MTLTEILPVALLCASTCIARQPTAVPAGSRLGSPAQASDAQGSPAGVAGSSDRDAPAARDGRSPIDRSAEFLPAFDHAIVISVDGLRSDALVALPPSELPGFTRLRRSASTLNARTDPEFTLTLPNHTAMLTGRPVLGADGHAWVANGEPAAGATLHSNRGAYVAGIFDVAHDHGLATALFAGKTKFALYDVSWNAENGAPDTTGADDGRDKIDVYRACAKTGEITDGLLETLTDGAPRTLSFGHYAVTDFTAHLAGWDVSPKSRYMQAVQAVDVELVRLLDGIESSPRLRGRVAIVLTSDHGGGAPFKSHDQPHMWIDYTIPFLAWTGSDAPEIELYALNVATRSDPSLRRPRFEDGGPSPIRNGDAGNLVLGWLGLPAVRGSTIGSAFDLRTR